MAVLRRKAPRKLFKGVLEQIKSIDLKKTLREYGQIALGAIIIGFSYNMFFIENNIVAGGISGLGVIMFHLVGIPVGVFTFVANIPLLLAEIKINGSFSTGLKTLFAVTIMSASIDILRPFVPTVTDNPMLFIAYGSFIDGLGVGLVMRAHGTLGGTIIIGRLVRKFTRLPVSQAIFISNAVIIGIAALVFGLEPALYGMIVAAVGAWAVDMVLTAGKKARQALIISDNWERIQKELFAQLGRGATLLPGTGAYTGDDRPVLMTIMSRAESVTVKSLVERIDPTAFVIISVATEVWGEGFSDIHEES